VPNIHRCDRDETVVPCVGWRARTACMGRKSQGRMLLRDVRRSFVFDILIARSCREIGATLVSRNATDLSRIAKVFSFDFVPPYPAKRRG
jgi:predicted nucleic acid-binding protein